MNFYESDIAVLLFFLFGLNALIKGSISFQIEAGKQGVNTFLTEKSSYKKGHDIIGWKARSIGIVSIILSVVVHFYMKGGDVIFSL